MCGSVVLSQWLVIKAVRLLQATTCVVGDEDASSKC